MPAPTSLIKGKTIENVKEDFRGAERVEQYRLGKAALYLPRGLQWDYVPYAAILRAERARRVISAGHCVTVREEKPAVDLFTEGETLTLNLEKQESAQRILELIPGGEAEE